MADFNDILNKIQTGAQIAAALEPSISLFGTDHQTATQQIIQIAGASVGAMTKNTEIANEAAMSAQLAASLVPLVFSFIDLFHKTAVNKTATPATVNGDK